jgi:hypothetical protein
MEVMLQWLDEIEDAFFVIALQWENVRRAVLHVGLAAAVALKLTQAGSAVGAYDAMLAALALVSVLTWCTVTVVLDNWDTQRGRSRAAP